MNLAKAGPAPARSPARRGAVLLFVLVALLLGVTAATAAATALALRSLGHAQRRDAALAERAADAATEAVGNWLLLASNDVVLAPDAEIPAVLVLDESLLVDGAELRVRATAFDQRGMVPWSLAATGSAFANWLPGDVRERLNAVSRPGDWQAGLDLLADAAPRSVYPLHLPATGGVRRFGSEFRGDQVPSDREAPGLAAVGALVATHAQDGMVVNANTAPLSLLARAEAALQISVSAGERRAAGVKVVVPAGTASVRGVAIPGEPSVRIVGSSDLWSVRIDACVGTARAARWLVWRRTGREWTIVQRLRIGA